MQFNPSGPFRIGDRVQLTDEKGKLYSINLAIGGQFHTHKGWIDHETLIGSPEGSIFVTTSGSKYQAFRPLLTDFVLSMPRG
ncbi:MAG: tRNA (adenine-N1)-methyltransferase, partial [Actinobacteria bacterium]|nr:tRNA (adenine-N1)-methyltransferase [Actinomycetota bacterium]